MTRADAFYAAWRTLIEEHGDQRAGLRWLMAERAYYEMKRALSCLRIQVWIDSEHRMLVSIASGFAITVPVVWQK